MDDYSLEQKIGGQWFVLIRHCTLEYGKERASEIFQRNKEAELQIVKIQKIVVWSLSGTPNQPNLVLTPVG